jgi:aconitase B
MLASTRPPTYVEPEQYQDAPGDSAAAKEIKYQLRQLDFEFTCSCMRARNHIRLIAAMLSREEIDDNGEAVTTRYRRAG